MKKENIFRYIVLSFAVLIFTSCGNLQPAKVSHAKSYPLWYAKKTLTPHAKYEVLGYGEGATLSEAKANAKEDIAQSLISRVDSSFVSSSNDTKSTTKSKLKVTSRLNLQNLKILKQEEQGGTFFVALSYENLDLPYRIKKVLKLSTCQDENPNSYMLKTPLYRK